MSTMHYVSAALAIALLSLGVMFVAYRRRVDRLVAEGNQRVQEAIGNPLLTGIHIGNGSMDIGMEGAGPQLLAGMFLGMFEKYPDAKNYIECRMTSSKGDVIVTVRKAEGKSPDALRREAEQKLAVAEKELAELRQTAGGVATSDSTPVRDQSPMASSACTASAKDPAAR